MLKTTRVCSLPGVQKFSVKGIDEILKSILQHCISQPALYSQSNSHKQAKFLKQPKTNGYGTVHLLSTSNLVKASGALQQYTIFGSLLSNESEIYSSLIQMPNMTEQSQQ